MSCLESLMATHSPFFPKDSPSFITQVLPDATMILASTATNLHEQQHPDCSDIHVHTSMISTFIDWNSNGANMGFTVQTHVTTHCWMFLEWSYIYLLLSIHTYIYAHNIFSMDWILYPDKFVWHEKHITDNLCFQLLISLLNQCKCYLFDIL